MELLAEQVIEKYIEALREAYALARAERLSELRGQRQRTFDARGVHPFSVAVGRVLALVDLYPPLGEWDFNLMELRREAVRDACLEYEQDVALSLSVREGWISQEQADLLRVEI